MAQKNKDSGIVNIRGKEYKTVALRVQEFRTTYSISDGWSICTEIISIDAKYCVVMAKVSNPEGKVVATGIAEEERKSSGVNSTSALENAETSAIGRALAASGFAGQEYASADELTNALLTEQADAKSIKEYGEWISQVQNCKALNEFFTALMKEGNTVKKAIKPQMTAKAKALGCTFDKSTNSYTNG